MKQKVGKEEEELVVYLVLHGSGRKRMGASSCLDESPN